MKNREDLQKELMLHLNLWFKNQAENVFERHYLYYKGTTTHENGEIMITNTHPPVGFKLAMGEAIASGLTIEQNFLRLNEKILGRLPVLELYSC